MPTDARVVYESGAEPEFVVTRLIRHEPLRDGMVRLYLGCERGDCIKVEYTVVCPITALAEMGRLCLKIAADVHNISILLPLTDAALH